MALSYALGQARATSAANPVSFSYTVNTPDKVIVLLIKGVGATNRAGGAPTWNSNTFTQANSTQKAAASPEASAELWYLLNPVANTATLTIPNTGPITLFYTVGIGRAPGRAVLEGAIGGNATSTNPTPGAVSVTEPGEIGFAITAGGWQTWAPSAQVGTVMANTDDGAHGSGEQYIANPTPGLHTLSWTFATSEDWGAVAVYFKELPPRNLESYKSVTVPDGLSTTERVR